MILKGGKPMLRKFGGSVIKAVLQLFPELNLVADKFSFLPRILFSLFIYLLSIEAIYLSIEVIYYV